MLNPKSLPSSASKNRGAAVVVPGESPKHIEVIRLYEDLTNLLVTNVRYQKGKYFDLEDCILTCIYTYINENESPDTQEGKSEFHMSLLPTPTSAKRSAPQA